MLLTGCLKDYVDYQRGKKSIKDIGLGLKELDLEFPMVINEIDQTIESMEKLDQVADSVFQNNPFANTEFQVENLKKSVIDIKNIHQDMDLVLEKTNQQIKEKNKQISLLNADVKQLRRKVKKQEPIPFIKECQERLVIYTVEKGNK